MTTLAKRTFSSVILIGLLGGSVFLMCPVRQWFFFFLCILLGFGASFEFCEMLNGAKKSLILSFVTSIAVALDAGIRILMQGSSVFLCSEQWTGKGIDGLDTLGTGIISGFFLLIVWFLIIGSCKKKEKMETAIHCCTVFFLFSFSLNRIVDLYFPSVSRETAVIGDFLKEGWNEMPFLFLYFILVTKSGDIGAYLTGSFTNSVSHGKNHKLAPSISPAKSIEGLTGGLILSVLVSVSLVFLFCDRNAAGTGWMIFLSSASGVLLYFGGMAGDLAESSLKRTCGVKDSGHFLPGIGGLFDLVDSLLLNATLFMTAIKFVMFFF